MYACVCMCVVCVGGGGGGIQHDKMQIKGESFMISSWSSGAD